MKRAVFAAATALLGGLGAAGLMAAAPASAACTDDPIPVGERIGCLTNASLEEFARTTSPDYNLKVLINGTTENPELGLKNQPAEFARSVGVFFSGPKAPEPAPDPAP